MITKNKNSCAVYDKYFIDDLLEYSLIDSGSSLNIKYSNNQTVNVDTSNVIKTIKESINKTKEYNKTPLAGDVWYPLFINNDTNNTKNNMLFKGSMSYIDTVGVEDAITFDAVFQNWSVAGPAKMTINWFINSFYTPNILQHGLLCWYKESTFDIDPGLNFYQIPPNSVLMPKNALSYRITDANNRTKLVIIRPTDKVIKIDNDLLRIVGASGQTFDSATGTFTFKSVDEFFSISQYISINYPRQNQETSDNYEKRINQIINSKLIFDIYSTNNSQNRSFLDPKSKKDICLYIANGESYSYFESEAAKEESYKEKNPSKTYISGTQYPIYREIFNILTANHAKKLTVNRELYEYRNIHKLACFLSTHPTIDRTTVNILTHDDIQLYVKDYIKNQPANETIENKLLYEAIAFITPYFKDLATDIKQAAGHTNFIRTQSQLFSKLVSKYSASLSIKNDTVLTYNDKLKYGPHAKISQDIISLADRNLQNTMVYNNFSVNVGDYNLFSNISNNDTSFILKNIKSKEPPTVIPLWDIAKKELSQPELKFSAGDDLKILFNPGIGNTELVYNLPDEDNSIITDSIFLEEEQPEILWTKISGPDCLRFSDANLSTIRSEGGITGPTNPVLVTTDMISAGISNPIGPSSDAATPPVASANIRFLSSTDPIPILYIKSRGKYVLQVRYKSSIGVFYDTKTIYVVDAQGFYDKDQRVEFLSKAEPIPISVKNKLTVVCPNMRSFAFGKQYIFMPIDSDISIKVKGQFIFGQVFPFGGNIFKFNIPVALDPDSSLIKNSDPVTLSLSYQPNNTTILVKKLSIEHMMDNNDDCYKCESFYKGVLDNKGFFIDAGGTFTLQKHPLPGQRTEEYDFGFSSELSTDKTNIYAYGGFSQDIVNKLDLDLPFHDKPGRILTPITGIEMTGPSAPPPARSTKPSYVCYPRPVDEYTTGINFEKGCFHPSSGWIVPSTSQNPDFSQYKHNSPELLNKTSVINFDASRRKTFVFKGAGFFELNNENTQIESLPQTYFSSIVLGVDEKARECRPTENKPCEEPDLIAAELEEIDDHDPNMGYRISSGEVNKLSIIDSDEFKTDIRLDPEGGTPSNEYCNTVSAQEYEVSYLFTKRGPYIDDDARTPISRFSKSIGSAKIEDLEVEVNFLNYVDTKNMIMWLDVVPCEGFAERFSKQKEPKNKWQHVTKTIDNSMFSNSYAETKFELENMPDGALKNYLLSLFTMNDNPDPTKTLVPFQAIPDEQTQSTSAEEDGSGSVFRLYLLNQEHIEGNRYNFSLRFSDNANKYTTPYNTNHNEYFDPQQIKSVEKDGVIHLLPTVATSGYTDNEVQFFRKIIQTNNLDTINNKFMKFSGLPLFQGPGPVSVNTWGSTKFVLGIAVMHQSTEMNAFDSVDSPDIVNNIEKTIIANRSNILINNICSWNLILHINSNGHSCNRFRPDDSIGNLSYQNSMNPYIPGYSFITNLKDKQFLLPPLNLNAPYSNLLDSKLCRYSKEKLTAPSFSYTPLNLLPFIIITSAGTLIDAIAQTISVDSQGDQLSRGIVGYLNTLRRQAQSEEYFRSLFVPKYDKYPMGGSDKILLSVSKDGAIWYKLEASIFRYINCPLINRKKYSYLKLNYETSQTLSIFNFSKIETLNQLIDLDIDNIKIVAIPIEDVQNLSYLNSKDLEQVMMSLVKNRERLEERVTELRKTLAETTNQNTTVSLNEQISELLKQISDLSVLILAYETTIQSIGFRVKKFDIVIVLGAGDYNASTKGVYFINSDALDTKPKPPDKLDEPGQLKIHYLLHKLRKDNLLSFSNIQLELQPRKEDEEEQLTVEDLIGFLKIKNHIISTDGLRAFYFFEIDDEVTIIKPIEEYLQELRNSGNESNIKKAEQIEEKIKQIELRLEQAQKNQNTILIKQIEKQLWYAKNILTKNKILNKGYIYKSNGYTTLLELELPPNGSAISFSPEQSVVGVIYDGDYSTIDSQKDIAPYNKWAFVQDGNSKIHSDCAPEINVSTFGEHSYGTGSMLVDPPILTKKPIKNIIPSIEEYIETNYTPCKRNITVYIDEEINGINTGTEETNDEETNDEEQEKNQGIATQMIGYAYSANDITYIKNNVNAIEINSSGLPMDLKRFFNKNDTYTNNYDNMAIMDVRSDLFRKEGGLLLDYGYLELDLGMKISYPEYVFDAQQTKIIENRLNFLTRLNPLTDRITSCASDQNCIRSAINSANPEQLSIDDTKTFINNSSYLTSLVEEKIELAKNRLPQLENEFQTILMYCEKGKITITEQFVNENSSRIICTPYVGVKAVPINKIEIKINSNNQSLDFIDSVDNDYYWINIDPEQSCSIDVSETPKILVNTKIECLLVNDQFTFEARNVCPRDSISVEYGEDTNISSTAPGITEYSIPEDTFNTLTQLYAGKNAKLTFSPYNGGSFPREYLYTVTRFFTLNMSGKERNQLVKSTETYLLPLAVRDDSDHTEPDGSVTTKVKNIFNLDNINQLNVKPKRIPRKIKGIDNSFDLYRPNALGALTKSLIPAPGGPIDSTPKYWHCFDTEYGNLVNTPDYFKMLNEMIFRGYYGSMDAAEFKGSLFAESKELTNWMPYDYL